MRKNSTVKERRGEFDRPKPTRTAKKSSIRRPLGREKSLTPIHGEFIPAGSISTSAQYAQKYSLPLFSSTGFLIPIPGTRTY